MSLLLSLLLLLLSQCLGEGKETEKEMESGRDCEECFDCCVGVASCYAVVFAYWLWLLLVLLGARCLLTLAKLSNGQRGPVKRGRHVSPWWDRQAVTCHAWS